MLKRMSVVFCGLAVVLMTAGAASAQTATQETKAKTKSAVKKTGDATENAAKKTATVLTDAEITAAVKTKFLADTKVSGLNINVDTDKHVVTLTGPVHSAAEKAEALRLARTTKGVKKVVSKLTLEPKK
jgi:hyperosmotically inducible protein